MGTRVFSEDKIAYVEVSTNNYWTRTKIHYKSGKTSWFTPNSDRNGDVSAFKKFIDDSIVSADYTVPELDKTGRPSYSTRYIIFTKRLMDGEDAICLGTSGH